MKLLQTQHLNAQFFDEFVDLQKPIETLRETLNETVFDLENLIKGKIVLDFLKGAGYWKNDWFDQGLLGKHCHQNHDGELIIDFDHSGLIAFNERIENEISTLEILGVFVKWIDNKYPYSEEISNAVLSLIEEVYEEWNETSKDRHEFDYYNLENVEQGDKTLSYLVLHAVDSEYSSSGSSIDSEVTIHFL